MRTFIRKGLGRIYVKKESDIEKVKEIIQEMDEFEYDYLPADFITTFSDYSKMIYVGKFDEIDMDELTAECWGKGIPIFCVTEEDN